MQIAARKYIAAEKAVRRSLCLPDDYEIKASAIPNKYKAKLFRSLNRQFRFGAIISQERVLDSIYSDKKDKQRYLDYVYKIMIKRYFKSLIASGVLSKTEAHHFHFYVDEHSTATNGRYELKDSIERELMYGTYNQTWDHRYEPIFDVVGKVDLKFSNSADVTLVRAADIIANRIHFKAYQDRCFCSVRNDFFVIRQP